MGYNSIGGNIPSCIGELSRLEFLFLADMDLEGALPESMSLLSNVDTLYLDNNRLSGDIVAAAANMEYLGEIYAEDNRLTGTLEEGSFADRPLLHYLDLSGNQIQGIVPVSLLENPYLQVLDLHNNQLSGELPATLEVHYHLEFVALQNNTIGGALPASLTNWTQLKHLDLSHNALMGPLPDFVADLQTLEYLFLARNAFTPGPIPSSWTLLSGIQELSLKGCQRTGVVPDYISQWTELRLLDLDDNDLEGEVPDLSALSELQFLWLNRNERLSGELSTLSSTLQAVFVDRTNLTAGDGALEALCPDVVAAANCERVACSCCVACCGSNGNDCHDYDQVLSLTPSWEDLYQRQKYELGNHTRLDAPQP